jgi:hypothetical protein
VLLVEIDGLVAFGGLSDGLHAGDGLDQGGESYADDGMVVDQHDPYGCGGRPGHLIFSSCA